MSSSGGRSLTSFIEERKKAVLNLGGDAQFNFRTQEWT